MNIKKSIAAVAALTLAISALAVPASAEVEGVVSQGRKYTYSLVKEYEIGRYGSVQVQSHTNMFLYEDPTGTYWGANDGFFISLEGIDTDKQITINVQPAEGVVGTAFNLSLILEGSNSNFIPAGITHIEDGFANDGTSDDHGDEDDFLMVRPGVVGFDGNAYITVTGTAEIPLDETHDNYKNLTAATEYISGMHTLDVFDFGFPISGAIGATPKENLDMLTTTNNYDKCVGWDDGVPNDGINETDSDLELRAHPELCAQIFKNVTNLTKPTLKTIYRPYKSTLNGGYGFGATQGDTPDIITWLQGTSESSFLNDDHAEDAAKLDDDGCVVLKTSNQKIATNNYVNVQAVINDCITSYPNVTFTFNTATEEVIIADNKYKDFYKSSSSSQKSTDMYMNAFGQSLYNNFGTENSGFVPFDENVYFNGVGIAYNLFSGALIINDQYSMQLTDTNVFSYSGTSLIFDWASLKDNVYTSTNTYLDLIWTLKLATSIPWFWDSLDIEFMPDAVDTGESEAAAFEDYESI